MQVLLVLLPNIRTIVEAERAGCILQAEITFPHSQQKGNFQLFPAVSSLNCEPPWQPPGFKLVPKHELPHCISIQYPSHAPLGSDIAASQPRQRHEHRDIRVSACSANPWIGK